MGQIGEQKTVTKEKPVMGYNTFHDIGCLPDEKTLMERVDTTISSGMRAAGYDYINIDDGWMMLERNAQAYLEADPIRFPSGMKKLTDYIHSKGMKAGIYLTCGIKTYADYPGSLGYEEKDAEKIAEWGFDLLKYDYRIMPEDPKNRDVKEENMIMSKVLRNNKWGRQILFSMCEHGRSDPWVWAGDYAEMWRVSTDIKDIWEGELDGGWCFNKIIDERTEKIQKHSVLGLCNDYDMLIVGLRGKHTWMGNGLTDTEYRTHFSLWCMLGAPLIHGVNPGDMDLVTKEILLNTEMIAVNQDALCISGQRIKNKDGLDFWTRRLSNNSYAIALYNRTDAIQKMSIHWSDLGLNSCTTLHARDLWSHSDVGTYKESFSRDVASHECAVIKLLIE